MKLCCLCLIFLLIGSLAAEGTIQNMGAPK